jgi:outer membrane protein assembly factor BamB
MASQTTSPTGQTALRLWPGVLIVVLQWVGRFVVPVLWPEAGLFAVLGGMLGAVAVVVWWLFFSRAPWSERLGAIALMIAALAVTPRFLHVSLATAGQGILYFVYALPLLSLMFVGWALVSRRLAPAPRWLALAATIVVACGGWTLVQTGGVTGDTDSDFFWRWSATPEERLLAQAGDDPIVVPGAAVTLTEADWPGFRGPARDGVVRGVRIKTGWEVSPPVELWRRPIGPGWSSFAVGGDLIYTQEQRGEDEVVAAYRLSTGEPVWRHRDRARFYESNGGAGPRATPTLRDGRVYTFGATGILNVLNAGDGSMIWSRDVVADSDARMPGWGFAGSPLIIDDVVVVAAGGRLVGYEVATGRMLWVTAGGGGYSSPHRVTLDGVTQVVFISGAGALGVDPSDGTTLWEHAYPGAPIVQPALTADGDLLLSTGGDTGGRGTRRISVTLGPDGWATEERWSSIRLKPYFSDYVVHGGHAYGFDGSIMASINLEDGERNWKGGRYGHGQLVLLADQDVLLVITEEGELALVAAAPDEFTEIARFPGIDGKTWNHPVLVRDVLLVRNGEEMVAFRLPLADS